MSGPAWGHDALARDLADHLSCQKTMVWTDIQLGPAGSPRPDVYAVDKSFVHPNPRAYEVKVSAADYRADVTAGKWRSYLYYAGSVTFAVPAGLVDPKEIPPLAGLMVRGDVGWRTLRRPVPAVVEVPEVAWLKLLMDGVEREGPSVRARRYHEAADGADRFAKKFGAEAALWVRNRGEAEDRIRAAEYGAERITDQARRDAERWRKDATDSAPELWRDLCRVLGCPETCSSWAVRDAIAKARTAAEGGVNAHRIRSLRMSLANSLAYVDEIVAESAPKPKEVAS